MLNKNINSNYPPSALFLIPYFHAVPLPERAPPPKRHHLGFVYGDLQG